MSDIEQNKRINHFRRQLARAVERIKTLELDIEPGGRISISEAFSVLEDHIDASCFTILTGAREPKSEKLVG